MFAGWDSFYLMIGGAAGALIGLMFVVATLSGNLEREKALAGASIYMTPTVVAFGAVLLLSALTAVPGLQAHAVADAVGAIAAVGLIYSTVNAVRLRRGRVLQAPHWTDFWCYGVFPAVAYLALAGAAWTIAADWPFAARALAAVLVAMLALAIRNAWDLVTWMAPAAK